MYVPMEVAAKDVAMGRNLARWHVVLQGVSLPHLHNDAGRAISQLHVVLSGLGHH